MAGLFDFQDPQQIRNDYMRSQMVSPAQMSQQSLLQQLTSQMSNAGTVIGNVGAGMMGLQLPEEQRQAEMQGIMKSVDTSTVEGLKVAAQQFAKMGDTARAQALTDRANQLEDMEMKRKKLAFDMQPTAPETTKLDKLLREQAKYPEGSPAFKAYEGAINKETAAAAGSKSSLEKLMDVAGVNDPNDRQAMAKKALSLQLQANKGDPTAAAALSLMTKQLELTILQQKIEVANKKATDAETAEVQGASQEAWKTNNILSIITKAKGQVGGNTAGLGGAIMSKVAGTDAVDLQENLLTIKANIGFNELTQMRKASPTGGALGQVSDMENKALQAARASLEQKQSPDQLRENLTTVSDSYERWLKVITGEWTEEKAQEYLDSLKSKNKAPIKVTPTSQDSALISKYLTPRGN